MLELLGRWKEISQKCTLRTVSGIRCSLRRTGLLLSCRSTGLIAETSSTPRKTSVGWTFLRFLWGESHQANLSRAQLQVIFFNIAQVSRFGQTKGLYLLKGCRTCWNSLLVTNILPYFARKTANWLSEDRRLCSFNIRCSLVVSKAGIPSARLFRRPGVGWLAWL